MQSQQFVMIHLRKSANQSMLLNFYIIKFNIK